VGENLGQGRVDAFRFAAMDDAMDETPRDLPVAPDKDGASLRGAALDASPGKNLTISSALMYSSTRMLLMMVGRRSAGELRR
jgi:hypothetical protein